MTHVAHHFGTGPFATTCRCECTACVDPTRPPGCICPTCTCRAGARNDFHVASPWVRSA
jgi:hypothetical protein